MSIVWKPEVQLSSKRVIRVGDTVELLKEKDFIRKMLGEKPYIVAHIGRWSCGRYMLYFKTTDGEPGFMASDFI